MADMASRSEGLRAKTVSTSRKVTAAALMRCSQIQRKKPFCERKVCMMTKKFSFFTTLALATILAPRLAAQVQTDVPPQVPGAKPVALERIKVHGVALEGNLEADAVDHDVFVFLPPSYAQ